MSKYFNLHRNVNENHFVIPSDSWHNGYYQGRKYQQMLARILGEKNCIHHCKPVQPLWKPVQTFLKRVEIGKKAITKMECLDLDSSGPDMNKICVLC